MLLAKRIQLPTTMDNRIVAQKLVVKDTREIEAAAILRVMQDFILGCRPLMFNLQCYDLIKGGLDSIKIHPQNPMMLELPATHGLSANPLSLTSLVDGSVPHNIPSSWRSHTFALTSMRLLAAWCNSPHSQSPYSSSVEPQQPDTSHRRSHRRTTVSTPCDDLESFSWTLLYSIYRLSMKTHNLSYIEVCRVNNLGKYPSITHTHQGKRRLLENMFICAQKPGTEYWPPCNSVSYGSRPKISAPVISWRGFISKLLIETPVRWVAVERPEGNPTHYERLESTRPCFDHDSYARVLSEAVEDPILLPRSWYSWIEEEERRVRLRDLPLCIIDGEC